MTTRPWLGGGEAEVVARCVESGAELVGVAADLGEDEAALAGYRSRHFCRINSSIDSSDDSVRVRPGPCIGMGPDHPAALLAAWRERAQFLADFGDPHAARLWQLAAVELERALATVADETLSLVEAARVSGYTPDYVGHPYRAHTRRAPALP